MTDIIYIDADSQPLLEEALSSIKQTEQTTDTNFFLQSPVSHCWVAVESALPVGYLIAYSLPRVDCSLSMFFLYEVSVAPEHQRKGVGRKLVEAFLHVSETFGGQKAFVLTNKSNHAALQLYRSCGGKNHTSDDILIHFDLAANDVGKE